MNQTITIIDTFGFFFRSFFALPPLRNSQGFPTGLLTGFVKLVDSLHRDHSTDYLVFALDSKGKTFRNTLFEDYKANRPPAPQELLAQLPIAIEWIEKMGFANLSQEGFEADDIITTVTHFAKAKKGLKVRIVSHDKDLYQLIEEGRVVMYDSVKKREIGEKEAFEKFGVYPRDFTNFQAILGDSSDNIPGVKGIGQKGASKLINEFGTLENIYAHIDTITPTRTQSLLLQSKESAFLSRELVTLRGDVVLDCDLQRFVFEEKNYLSCLKEEFAKYEMHQALKSATKEDSHYASTTPIIPKETKSIPTLAHHTLNTTQALNEAIDSIPYDALVAFDTETTGLDTKRASLVGFSFCFDEAQGYYVPIAHSYLGVGEQVALQDALIAIKRLFMHHKIVGQNLKFDLSLLYNRYGFERYTPFGDSMILAWLYDSSLSVGLDALAKRYFGYTMKPFKEMVKKGEDFSYVDIDSASFYASEDAWMCRKVYSYLVDLFHREGLEYLLEEAYMLEIPFINTLAQMEARGIKMDTNKLKSLESKLNKKLHTLTLAIYAQAGGEFNIKSTQQLGVVLFETLKLQGSKKTKTGYSTNEQVLSTLIEAHPIVPLLLEYREHQKILSTYVTPLIRLAQGDAQGRVYTSFIQTGTTTGRLSSKDPNLQNIPVRSALGREVREAFVAKEGYKLVGIDYSQIELRLLAHFSQDEALNEAFRKGLDIHLATAIKLFGEEEAKAKRSFAKSINFGLLYGMGSRKLSDELHISTQESKVIIENYFKAFPSIKSFLEGIKEGMKSSGFVQTLLQRRRIFDYTHANAMIKASYERESVNTLFQGSAADLIKLSMVEIERVIEAQKMEAQMLLQIHDELIFEIEESKAQKLGEKFAKIMENIRELNVPLECSISIGDSWGELK